MKLLGFTILERTKALAPPDMRGGWFPFARVLESFAGAWQQNVTVDRDQLLAQNAIFACITLIASDIAKLRVKLVAQDDDGIWTETANPAFSPVLRKPNHFQNRIQFIENWMISKLTRGNTYTLKQRDGRGIVTALYVLDPCRVKPLIADDGSIFYELARDQLSGQDAQTVLVPAREIIHDRMNCLYHPLVGISPLWAAGLTAAQSLNIQKNSSWFFANRSMPGGILTAPGNIDDAVATRLKSLWETNFGGEGAGKIAVLGDGLKFEPLTVTAHDAELVNQLKWSGEVVCSVFHVPPYKIGLGTMPAFNNIQALNVEYYSQCLQRLIEDFELCLDEGLGMTGQGGQTFGTECDVDGLLRMDSMTQITVEKEAVGAGIKAPNESRKKLDLKPVAGGDSPYLQQQNFSLEALSKRDALDDPFGSKTPPPQAPPPTQRALPAPDMVVDLSPEEWREVADEFERAAA